MGTASPSRARLAGAAAALLAIPAASPSTAEMASYRIVGDSIPDPLEGRSGDAQRGRALVLDRSAGNCLICHAVPEPAERFMGNLGPDLAGAGSRLTPGQLRLRMVDGSQLNADTIMPPYYRVEGLTRVGAQWRGAPVLNTQQIEDVVAYLASLRVTDNGRRP